MFTSCNVCPVQRVSESSTGDATPTSEGEGDASQQADQQLATHPGGAVSLSAAISRISGPQSGLSVSTQPGPGPGRHSNQPSPHGQHYSQSPPTPGHDSLPSPLAVARLSSLQPPTPAIQLTPSLNRLYKEQLIGHVLAWPAEHVERAINKVGEDANTISNHTITKVVINQSGNIYVNLLYFIAQFEQLCHGGCYVELDLKSLSSDGSLSVDIKKPSSTTLLFSESN